jgi:cob(I)alamin adenosyltransferase
VKIYTKTGDDGTTGLLGNRRVTKDDPRVAAYGEVDELNAALGVVRAQSGGSKQLATLLQTIQRDLFAIGAQLADPTSRVVSKRAKAAVPASAVLRLEKAIDVREKTLPPLTAFILPGGDPLGAHLHLARTVCRRAERSVVSLHRAEPLHPRILEYLNRLSDLLFVLARDANHRVGVPEDRW